MQGQLSQFARRGPSGHRGSPDGVGGHVLRGSEPGGGGAGDGSGISCSGRRPPDDFLRCDWSVGAEQRLREGGAFHQGETAVTFSWWDLVKGL